MSSIVSTASYERLNRPPDRLSQSKDRTLHA